MRMLGPLVVVSTAALFSTGVALIVLGPHEGRGIVLGLHKASFVVWLVVTGLHVLVYAPRLRRLLFGDLRPRTRIGGSQLRRGALAAALSPARRSRRPRSRWPGRGSTLTDLTVSHPTCR